VHNDNLASLEGLEGLTSVSGALSIGYNSSLTSLSGLDNLAMIEGYLSIYNNDVLISLDGLGNLVSIGDMLEIISNPNLTNMTALENLASIGNYLWLRFNPSITSLSGLENIDPATITDLVLMFNSELSACDVKSICEFLASQSGTVQINDNAAGCNNQSEVEMACLDAVEESYPSENLFTISPNPSSTQITIETTAFSSKFQISIFNLNVQEVMSCQIAEHNAVVDISDLPGGVYFVRMTGEKAVVVEKFIKID